MGGLAFTFMTRDGLLEIANTAAAVTLTLHGLIFLEEVGNGRGEWERVRE